MTEEPKNKGGRVAGVGKFAGGRPRKAKAKRIRKTYTVNADIVDYIKNLVEVKKTESDVVNELLTEAIENRKASENGGEIKTGA